MLPDPFQGVRILTGPTGSGKTALGVELAERLGAEIISMDSMALYRGLDVGTAKPGPDERRRIPHHLVDVLEPWESASVAWWLREAARCTRAIQGRGRQVLLVGGTPLYLKALVCGLFEGPPADPDVRRRLMRQAQEQGSRALHERLAAVDPEAAARLHPNDLRRLTRALEVWELTGRPISSWQGQWRQPLRDREVEQATDGMGRPSPRVLWLDLPRDVLYARIDRRVEHMLAAGWVEEAQALRRLPRPLSQEASQALGYRELFAYLDGRASWETTVDRIQTRSRQFAKRQLTWFRHLPACRPATRELTFALWDLTMDGESGGAP